ncbi:hypothetical protein GCM10009733_055310 [Nonomuraea maheshkhaliensis]|uniref:Uncharacterized protein n=1 Tax=Nonomuraea maheshkhaliensis TaxID=419590 RepID=A0ABN2FKE1_9ACTN
MMTGSPTVSGRTPAGMSLAPRAIRVSPLLIRVTAKHTVAAPVEAFRMSYIRGIGGKAVIPSR